MDDLLSGDSSVADYLQATGGSGSPYLQNQTPFDALDNGLLQSDAGNVTNSNGQVTGTTGSSTSSTPGWLQSILAIGGNLAGTAVTQNVTPLINGKPATSPAPVTGQVSVGGMSSSTLLLIVAAILAFFFLSKKRA